MIIEPPEVSVIIPTYNRSNLLRRAIDSVRKQSFHKWELIVVDDASDDDTENVVREYGDARISYLRQVENMGAPAAKNRGIHSARGEWIAFLDSDDEYSVDKLSRQLDAARSNPGADVVYAGWEWVSDLTGERRILRMPDSSGRINSLPRWVFNIIPDLLIRKSALTNIKYDETAMSFEHLAIILPLWKERRAVYVPMVAATCYAHDGARRSDRIAQSVPWLMSLMKLHDDLVRMDRAGYSELHFKVGALLHDQGQYKLSLQYLKDALRKRPFHFKTWLYSLRSYRGVQYLRRDHHLRSL